MGREARAEKERVCNLCEEELFYVTAQELKDHVYLCRIAKRSGLILPERIIRPTMGGR